MEKSVWGIISLVIICICLVGCNSDDMIVTSDVREEGSEKTVDFVLEEGIKKIGIISVWSDVENNQYAYKEEIFTTDEQLIRDIVSIINDGDIDNSINIDRLPAEYEVQIYYEDETLKCYYWYDETQYNFNMSSINGEITLNHIEMDKMMRLLTGETDKIKLVNPY